MSFGTLGVFGNTLGSPIIQVLPFGERSFGSIAVLTEDGQLWVCGNQYGKGNLGIGTTTNAGFFTRVNFTNGKIIKLGAVGGSTGDISLCFITDDGLYWQTGTMLMMDHFLVMLDFNLHTIREVLIIL